MRVFNRSELPLILVFLLAVKLIKLIPELIEKLMKNNIIQ